MGMSLYAAASAWVAMGKWQLIQRTSEQVQESVFLQVGVIK
jgi:hypothetical protein